MLLAEERSRRLETDADAVLSPADKLRQRFPNLLSLRREETERIVLGRDCRLSSKRIRDALAH